MDPRKERAELHAKAMRLVDGAKAAARDLTADEQTEVKAALERIETLDKIIAEADQSKALMEHLSGTASIEDGPESLDDDDAPGTLGDRFVKSGAYQAFRKSHPGGVEGSAPIHIEAKGIGGLDDLGIGTKATITTGTGQPERTRLPGYRNTLLDQKITFLDLVTTGTTNSSYLEYVQVVSETNSAAIVPEGDLKPLSDLTTARGEAKAFTYADGFDVTNQTLADDGALSAFMQARLRWHLQNKVEDVLLNGNGVADPKGILNTTGVQAQPFATDVITTLAAALQKVEAVQVEPQAIVMNPADVWALRLLKDTTGQFLLGNPFQQNANAMPFGVPLVTSTRVAAGKAVIGNFSGVQLLEREPLSVVAFNQHKDYAQRNMTYVRAELRALQFIYAPREIVVATIKAA